ncbi:MAG: ABC transporter permease [Desulfuromonas sp.]|nr:MAG: ABC transporter permease [Desulfuromonas sp.]
MTLESIVLSNLKRRKGRMIFLILGLLLGVATVVTLISLSSALTADVQHKMDNYGANILITPRSDQLSLNYGGIDLGGVSVDSRSLKQADLQKIGTIPDHRNIAAVAPKVLGTVRVGDQRVMLMGVDIDKEFHLKKWWSIEGLPVREEAELVAGRSAAEALGLRVGDTVAVENRTFRVSGLLQKTGSQDDHLLIVSLPVAQDILNKQGTVTLVEVAALCADCPVTDMVDQISAVLPDVDVSAIQQVVKTRMHAFEQFQQFSLAIATVVVLVGALVVFVTMMGAVKERTREIGIFRALGFRRSHIIRLVLLEAALLSVVAGLCGYLSGMGVSRLVLPVLTEGHVALYWDPLLAVAAVALALSVGALASFYPALHASRLDPTEALRAL